MKYIYRYMYTGIIGTYKNIYSHCSFTDIIQNLCRRGLYYNPYTYVYYLDHVLFKISVKCSIFYANVRDCKKLHKKTILKKIRLDPSVSRI